MALGGGRGLTSVDAQRWLRGLRLFRGERLLLTLIFLVLADHGKALSRPG